MDSDEEALLVRMCKDRKRPLPDWEAGAGDRRLRALARNYRDRLEETEAKEEYLAQQRKRRQRLRAEVKILRWKYESFMKDEHSEQYKLKKRVRRLPSPATRTDHAVGSEMLSANNGTNLHLDQDTAMNNEGLDGQRHQSHPELDKFGQFGADEDSYDN